VSSIQGNGNNTTKILRNPWDVVILNDTIWTSVNGSWTLQQYTLDGVFLKSVFVTAISDFNKPTGLVTYNGNSFLYLNGSGVMTPSKLITVTETGTINAYDPVSTVNVAPITFSDSIKVFTGCDIFNDLLYVANFISGFVEVYNGTFSHVSQFTDEAMTSIGYAPYNVKFINGNLYVTFAKQDPTKHFSVFGSGYGYVDIFSPDGTYIKRFANRDTLNAPWAIMPYRIMINNDFVNVILVGNFGDGKISVFTTDGTLLGFLHDANGTSFVIDGLWGFTEWQGKGNRDTIYFVAGINNRADGLIGSFNFV
jgi:uncharacterized protein (TIGR03118 family)